ncbi:methyltransferase domain-containing protein [Mariprofundus sp. KV]|uniref:class I SAM-dependent methyltransferase n=1 Tax=Mariprofundus sp. KV TaxID=2608715 RepID=UPI0015A062B9|nr:methyltransferase domain-containing protein [Mariprofundus sp. KV]NWF35548.1 methyltransferase domain-containing protein [Mariprofundus sp. KV]
MKDLLKRFCGVTGIPTYFLRNLFFEVRMMFIRLYGWLPMFRKRLSTAMLNDEPAIVFGCGDTSYPGWTHMDCFFADHVDLVFDLRRRLPFENQSIARCYSEHFMEHLLPVEAKQHLSDVYRVLKPGGVYRVVVPDTGKFMRKYAEGDVDFIALAHPWEEHAIDAIYSIVNWGGDHRSIYDFETLERYGRAAGFEKVVLSAVNSSDDASLHIDRDDEHRIAESIYVEMVKAG